MSNLQVLARRCPVMGKAMAVQSARHGSLLAAGVRAYHGNAKDKSVVGAGDRAMFHSAGHKEAQAVDVGVRHKNASEFVLLP
jgi:5-aminolevulinate synthase